MQTVAHSLGIWTALMFLFLSRSVGLKLGNRTDQKFSPELEYKFPLLIVVGYLTHRLPEADGHLSVVWNAVASALAVFIETETSFS